MTHRHAGLLALLALAGCSSREACSFDASLTPVESTSSRGDRVFSFGGEREEIDVELALSGLPELWAPEGAIQGGRLSVRLAFAYDGVPVDGTVEMPSIGVSFEHAEGSGSSSPYATNLSVDGFTFTTCAAEEDRGC
jgi:hypothetical protein